MVWVGLALLGLAFSFLLEVWFGVNGFQGLSTRGCSTGVAGSDHVDCLEPGKLDSLLGLHARPAIASLLFLFLFFFFFLLR